MTEKNINELYNIRWNSSEPRFIVMECKECSDDKAFQNNKCVYNQRLGFAYSIDDIVEILNNTDEIVIENFNLEKENKEFKDRVFNIIDKNIDKLQRKYDFGQKNGMCPMHNIIHSINTLKNLKKEL